MMLMVTLISLLFSTHKASCQTQPSVHQKLYFSKCNVSVGQAGCSVDLADKIVTLDPRLTSTSCFGKDVLCAWKCQRDPKCVAFNLHENSQKCDIYYSHPSAYQSVTDCAHFQNKNLLKCQITDPNPCLNGGSCVPTCEGFICMCQAGFTGSTCAANINECSSTPCLNSGICSDGINRYTCTCMPGFNGANCETNINECISNPCLNGAACNDGVNMYTCSCAAGYAGLICQTDINECASQPCNHGGTCIDHVNSWSCICPDRYELDNCWFYPCLTPNNCENEGTALCTGPNDFGRYCVCRVQYGGSLCEINLCGSNPCDIVPQFYFNNYKQCLNANGGLQFCEY